MNNFSQNENKMAQNKLTILKEIPQRHHPSSTTPVPEHKELGVTTPRKPGSQPFLAWAQLMKWTRCHCLFWPSNASGSKAIASPESQEEEIRSESDGENWPFILCSQTYPTSPPDPYASCLQIQAGSSGK